MPPYTLKTSARAKHIRITIKRDGTVIVTKPVRASVALVERFVASKADWITAKVKEMTKNGIVITHTKREIQDLKQKALLMAEEKVGFFNRFYNFTYNHIRIKNQKTRWGSCSKRGNLNFNYKLAILPEELADYLVVHEVCHLGEFNHSKKFWDLVEKTIPDYKVLRQRLQKIAL
jgi:predicted metal-dependent hydrolase